MEHLFLPSMLVHDAYLALIVWSILFPQRRIWPPLRPGSWKYGVSWGLFFLAVGSDLVLMVQGWGSWLPLGPERYALGAPFIAVGAIFLLWGWRTLGTARTSGVAGAFVREGPYRLTRNPQYVGDIFLLLGLIIVSDSFEAGAGLALLILAFLLLPLAEEPWLEEAYGERYAAYKATTPRFL